jgi:hypothetical protein
MADPNAPFCFAELSHLLDRAARARRLSMITTDGRAARDLEQFAVEIETQIDRLSREIATDQAADDRILLPTRRPG